MRDEKDDATTVEHCSQILAKAMYPPPGSSERRTLDDGAVLSEKER